MDNRHGIALEVLIPDPTVAGFRLGTSALGTTALRAEDPDTFRLGISTLGQGRLAPIPVAPVWHNILAHVSHIEATRGNRTDTPAMPPDVGTLTATLVDAPRLAAMGVQAGTPIRLTWQRSPENAVESLWSGWVDDLDDSLDLAEKHTHTTIVAHDPVQPLSTTTRYGSLGGGSVLDRIRTIITQTAPIPIPAIHLMTGDDAPAADTPREASVADWLTMLATTAQLRWTITIDPLALIDGQLREHVTKIAFYAWDEGNQWPRHHFTDETTQNSYFSLTGRQGTADLITALELTNYGIGADGQVASTETQIRDHNLINRWGWRPASIDTCAPTPELLPLADALTADATGPTVTALTINGPDAKQDPATPYLAPLDTITVRERGRTHHLVVGSLTHTITPTRWRTTLATTRRRNPHGQPA